MTSPSEPPHLSGHHRRTLDQLFSHPVNHNLEWPAVRSLLEAVGSVEEQHDGKLLVSVGAETEVFGHPRHKDVDTQLVIDLRSMLAKAGYGPEAPPTATTT